MSSKWDDNSVIVFLNAYEKQPCLWNRYDKDYYNCAAKNEALRKIINNVNLPAFTVADYLHQIKTIREKYRTEQIRMIKELRSQKQYKSPFPWYNIVAGMLAKVIQDEEKTNCEIFLKPTGTCTSTVKSLSTDDMKKAGRERSPLVRGKRSISPCTDRSCTSAEKTKSVKKVYGSHVNNVVARNKRNNRRLNLQPKYILCPYFKGKENVLKTAELKETGDPTIFSPKSLIRENMKIYNAPLQCPSCGWEEVKYEKSKINAERAFHEQSVLRKNIPHYEHSSSSEETYNICIPYGQDFINMEMNTNVGDLGLEDRQNREPGSCMIQQFHGTLDKAVRTKSNVQVHIKRGIEKEVQYNIESNNMLQKKSQNAPIGEEILEFNPKLASKFDYGIIKTCKKLEIVLSDLNKNLKTNVPELEKFSQGMQVKQSTEQELNPILPPEVCTDGTQCSLEQFPPKRKTKEASVNAIDVVDQDLQSTVCMSKKHVGESKLTCCASIQTLDQVLDKVVNKCCAKVSIPIIECTQVAVNTLEQADKEVQSSICVSHGTLTNYPFEEMKEAESNTMPPVRRDQSTFCVSSNLKAMEEKQTNCVLLNLNEKCVQQDQQKFGEEVTQCIKANLDQYNKESVQQFDSPCTRKSCVPNIVELMKEDSVVSQILEQLVYKLLLSRNEDKTQNRDSTLSKDYNRNSINEYKCNVKADYTIDITQIVDNLKECAIEILNSKYTNPLETRTSDKSDLNFDIHSSLSKELESKINTAKIQTSDANVDEATIFDESDLKPTFASTTIEESDEQLFGNKTALLEGKIEKSAQDKGISAHPKYRDFGISGTLCSRDAGTESSMRLLNESSVPLAKDGKVQEKNNIGTQKRDPILVRVIKCYDNRPIVRSDKETLVTENVFERKKNSIHKGIETCGRSTCMPYNNYERSVKASDPSTEKPYRQQIQNNSNKQSLARVTFECDPNCKGKPLNEDWTDVSKSIKLSNTNQVNNTIYKKSFIPKHLHINDKK